MKHLPSLLLCTLLLSLSASAQVYKTTDKYGNVVYSDKPNESQAHDANTEKVEVRPTNVVPATQPLDIAPEPSRNNKPKAPPYNIRIVSPTNEYTVPPGQRDLIIAVSTDLPLGNRHQIAYYMDGELLGKASVNNFSIREILRGEHQLSAKVVDEKGKPLSSSETVTVFVHRTSIIN